MKNFKFIFLISILLVLLIYVSNITSLPDNLILFQGEKINLKTVLGLSFSVDKSQDKLKANYEVLQTSTAIQTKEDYIGKAKVNLNLFGKIPVKTIDVNIIENTKVVVLGDLVGLKLYTNGVLVVGMSEISGIDNNKYKPYEKTGIKEGDMIIEVNKQSVTCTADLLNSINQAQENEITIVYVRDGNIEQTSIKPVKTEDNCYKIGLWVRDIAAGVGTVSFYEPSTGLFAALGHGILDIDTEELLEISTGDFVTANIVSIKKGERGNPGKIQGSIDNQYAIGQVYKNTQFGVFGNLKNLSVLNVNLQDTMEVAFRDEIKLGKASIICTLENNKKDKYEVEIQKIDKNNNWDNKSMVIKVTDKRLIDKTGGIIQGMSGSPIIQNGKLIGALTHVLVSEPTMGYGIFADMMIKQMREVK